MATAAWIQRRACFICGARLKVANAWGWCKSRTSAADLRSEWFVPGCAMRWPLGTQPKWPDGRTQPCSSTMASQYLACSPFSFRLFHCSHAISVALIHRLKWKSQDQRLVSRHSALTDLYQDTASQNRDLQRSLSRFHHSFSSLPEEKKYDKLIRWLGAPDPFVNHNAARKRHEPLTGKWLLESDD